MIDEIRQLAKGCLVFRVNDACRAVVLRLYLPDGLYYDAEPAELLADLQQGLRNEIFSAIAGVHAQGLRFAPTSWKGLHAWYVLLDQDGRSVSKVQVKGCRMGLPTPVAPGGALFKPELLHRADYTRTRKLLKASQAHGAMTGKQKLAELAEHARQLGLTLTSRTWAGARGVYRFKTSFGRTLRLSTYALNRYRAHYDQFQALAAEVAAIRPGYELLATHWRGADSAYQWQTPDGRLVTASRAMLGWRE